VSLIPARHVRIAVDTAPLIYFLNGDNVRASLVRPVLAASAAHEIELVVSVVLDGPAALSVTPVGREIGRLAAHLRAELGLRLADALIAATAIVTGCTALLGNDTSFRRLGDRIEYLHLDDHIAAPSPR
jgi:predicted nucleic acid-binding protein